MSRLVELAEAFRTQARGCRGTGSVIYADLLARAADAMDGGGPFARLVEGWEGHPILDALPLQVMGAVHRRVLAGSAPALAAHYPTAGGTYEPDGAWRALEALVAQHGDELRRELLPVQTNEVLRCCALIGGFLEVAAAHALALRVLELGSSAGLLLGFDRYRYELGEHRLGDPAARPVLRCQWRGAAPKLAAPLRVASRRGCDPRPLDLRRREERLRLASFSWPDQLERSERLHEALQAGLADPPIIDAEPAGRWLPKRLAEPRDGVATVVFQSVIWWYLSEAQREEVVSVVEAAGHEARADRPLSWLRLEGSSLEHAELRLRSWPGGEDRCLARSHWHGAWVEWQAPAS